MTVSLPIHLADHAKITNNDLVVAITTAHDDFTRQHAHFLLSLAEFHARGLASECGSRSTAHWIIRTFDVAPNTAYDYLRVASTLREYPPVAESFSDGRINYSKTRLIGPYLADDNVYDLLRLAESLSYRELEQALSVLNKPGASDSPAKENYFRMWRDKHSGRVKFSGELDPEHGERLVTALKIAELASLTDLSSIDQAALAGGQALDDALASAQAIDVAVPASPLQLPEDNATGSSRYGSPSQAKLTSSFLNLVNIAHSSPANSTRAPGAQVHILMTEDGHPHLPSNPAAEGKELSASVLNGYMRGHILDSKGATMKLGRKKRLVTDALAMAVWTAWLRQCAMPGCNHSQFIEFHHIVEWSRGGLTNPENILPLCTYCHSLVSKRIVELRLDPLSSRRLIFSFRDGSTFVSENRSLPLRVDESAPPYLGEPIPEPPIVINHVPAFRQSQSFDDE